ncbi:MAG TPA: hypothetical protein VG456_22520 [Candidatus Sulfopaludibacter sp.]|jgi:hypothetical protein|nr:hypothetical protein [Candidatus Sulfopaludibacter sp.]
MRTFHALSVAGGLLLLTTTVPRNLYAITGCNNGYLSGTYNAQVSSAAFSNVISTLNNNAGLTLGLTPNIAPASGGLVANGTSLVGNMAGLGRFYFDGNGGIVGLANYTPVLRALVGSYTINNDCTMTIKLNSGQAYGGVVVNQGQQVLFIETDSAAAGLTGTLSKSINYCAPFTGQQSFGFTYFGADAILAGASTGSSSAQQFLTFQPYSAVGTVTVDGAGTFTMTAFSTTGSGVALQSSGGTYTMNSDCSLRLNFASSATGDATAGGFLPPLGFSGLLSSNGNGAAGVLSVQNWQGGSASGTVIPQ